MSYYQKISKELEKLSMDTSFDQDVKKQYLSLFCHCQKYAQLYHINEGLANAKQVLKNYLDEDKCLTNNKRKTERKKLQSLNITSKLHIEFFWKLYESHFKIDYKEKTEKHFFKEIINGDYEKRIDEIWEEIFSDSDNERDSTKDDVIDSINEWIYEYDNVTSIKKLNLENLHNAMEEVKECFSKPLPNIEDSVEELIFPQMLSFLLECLEIGRVEVAFLMIAPIRRALVTGKTRSFTPGRSSVFFNLKLEYNQNQLDSYINAIKDLYDEYTEVQDKLNKILSNL